MILNLLRLHWKFIRKPSAAVNEEIHDWPMKYAIGVFILNFLIALGQSAKGQAIISDIMVAVFGIQGYLGIYSYILVSMAYGFLVQYSIQPAVARYLIDVSADEFDANKFRRLVFYSNTSGVIFGVLITLPLQLLLALIIIDGNVGVAAIVLIGITSILGLWGFVCGINALVIQWKGLSIYFGMDNVQKIIVLFVVPIILAIPFILLYGYRYLDFMKKYI